MSSLISDQMMWRSWFSFLILPSLALAREVALFEKIEKHSLDKLDGLDFLAIAKLLQTLPSATEDWLDLLVSQDFLVKDQACYRLSELSKTYLLPSSSYDWSAALNYAYQPMKRRCPIFRALYPQASKSSFWEKLAHHPLEQDAFIRAMDAHVGSLAGIVAANPLFSNLRHIMEWGSGSGRMARELLKSHPRLKMTLVDLESSSSSAQRLFDFTPYENRLEWIYGDVNQVSLPGAEAILMSHLTHHLEEKQLKILLERAKEHLPPAGLLGFIDLFKTDEILFEVSAFSLHLAQSAHRSVWSLKAFIDLLENHGFKMEACQKIGRLHHQILVRC